MPFTFDEIQQEWFGGEYIQMPPADVERAFAVAEELRGRDWVLGTNDFTGMPFPGIGRRGGFQDFVRVYWLGKRLESVLGSPGAESLIQRLIAGDVAAESELTAINLVRSFQPTAELEVAPPVAVGKRNRQPDFRIRKQGGDPWLFVEVTQLRRSEVSARVQRLLQRITDQVMQVEKAFILEIVLWRQPIETEEDQLVEAAKVSSEAATGERVDIGTVASVLVKTGEAAVVVPSIIPEDNVPRMAMSRAVVGRGQPNRQIIARIPFADQRTEDIVRDEAHQLPPRECGLVVVDATAQPTAFSSWPQLLPHRFTPKQHTRVAAVILFMYATRPTDQGLALLPHVNIISNPHAAVRLPGWVSDGIAELRAELRNLTGRPD